MDKSREKAIWQIMKLFEGKKAYLSEDSARKELLRRAKRNQLRYHMPLKFRGAFQRAVFNNGPYGTFDFYHKAGDGTAVLYLHGGAFSSRPTALHWQFVQDVYDRTGATIYMPFYPLAPKHSFKETYLALLSFYKYVIRKHKTVYIMGDSAGATLVLGLANLLKRENVLRPVGLVAMSPVVDMSFSNPEMKKYQIVDTMLSRDGAKYMCQTWAKGAGYKNPLVSPKYSNFKDFPDIYLFYGDYEIFCPDLRDFVNIVNDAGGRIFAVEQKRCFHVYPLMPIPKAYDTREMIASIILNRELACRHSPSLSY